MSDESSRAAARGGRRRLGVTAIDQTIAGASNVLVAVLAARMLDAASFGLFWLIFLGFLVGQGVSRAWVSEPLLLDPPGARARAGEALGLGLIIGVSTSACAVAVGAAVTDPRLAAGLYVLAACAPLILVQDIGRYLAIASGRPVDALVLDVLWLVAVVVAVGAVALTPGRSLWEFVLAWGGSGALAGLVALLQHRRSRLRAGFGWLRETWSVSWRYLVAYTTAQGSALAGAVLLAAVVGPAAMAGVQGALLLQRVFVVLQVAAMSHGLVEMAGRAVPEVRTAALRLTALTTMVAALNGLVILVLPDVLGRAVLGESWTQASLVLLPAAAQMLMMGMMSGARVGILARRRIGTVTWVDMAKTGIVLVAMVIGTYTGGAAGAMWAIAAGHAIGTVLWWLAFRRHLGAESSEASTTEGAA